MHSLRQVEAGRGLQAGAENKVLEFLGKYRDKSDELRIEPKGPYTSRREVAGYQPEEKK